MADSALRNRRILVVEDEYYLAEELSQSLSDAGAFVLGPVASIERALILLKPEPLPDGALLDVNLGGEQVYPLADALIGRGIPIVFTTGYDRATLPRRFATIPMCEKPINIRHIIVAMSNAICT